MTRVLDHNENHTPLTGKSPLQTSPNGLVAPQPRSLPTFKSSPDTQVWNTKDLKWRILSDFTAAASSSALIAPLITIIDRSIIEKASTQQTLRSSILRSCSRLLTRPHIFLTSKPCLLVSALYLGTYFTANSIDTLSSTLRNRAPADTTSGSAKFVATSSVNMSLCLYKDSQFARMFGASAPSVAQTAGRVVPLSSYALFAMRDSLTIFASFNLPPLIAPILPLSKEAEKYISKRNAAQFLAPAAIQLLSTPLHLWGLDQYNRPTGHGITWRCRLKRVGRDWLSSSAARMSRIIPAFGIGGVVNARVRENMMRHCKH